MNASQKTIDQFGVLREAQLSLSAPNTPDSHTTPAVPTQIPKTMNASNQTPLHPMLRSLWNIPHIIRLPDQMPPVSEVLELLQRGMNDYQTQQQSLDPNARDYSMDLAVCKTSIAVLQHKIEEIQKAFPPEKVGPPRVPETSANQTTPNANDAIGHQKTFTAENSGQTEQPLPTQQNSNWPDTGQTVANTGQCLPNAGQHWPDSGQPLPDAGQQHHPLDSHKTNAGPGPNANQRQPSSQQDVNDSSDGDRDKSDRPDNEHSTDNDKDSDHLDEEDHDDEDREELDFHAQMAGYQDHAELMAEAAADLQAALNKRNRFDALSPEAQAVIIDMLDQYKSRHVAKLLRRPPPQGMNFKISKSGLNYFAKRYRQRQTQRRQKQNSDRAIEHLNKSPNPSQAFLNLYERMLHVKALTAATDPDTALDTLGQLTATITKLRKQTLAERKQSHIENSK